MNKIMTPNQSNEGITAPDDKSTSSVSKSVSSVSKSISSVSSKQTSINDSVWTENNKSTVTYESNALTLDSTSDSNPHVMKNEYVDPKIAQEEQKVVTRTKALMVIVMMLAVAVIVTATHLVVKNDEKDDFEAHFDNYASQVIAVAQENSRSTFDAIEAFAVTISSYADETNKKWPYVRIPDFAARATQLIKISNATFVGMAPIINNDLERWAWYGYTAKNMKYSFEEDIKYMNMPTTPEMMQILTLPKLFKLNLTTLAPFMEDRPPPWVPLWQGHPTEANQPTILNYNILNGPRINNTFQTAFATSKPAINFLATAVASEESFQNTTNEDYAKGEVKINYKAESQIIQPIFERVHDDYQGEKKMVAALWLVIDWLFYFQNVLPPGANGIVVVLKSSCIFDGVDDVGVDSVTYEINGVDAILVGENDQHDTAYTDFEIAVPFVSFDHDERKILDGTCAAGFSLHLYPSRKLELAFLTNKATIYTIIVVAVFAFTSIVFIMFDLSVKRRQDKVMARAIRQDKIVSNLFPVEFRDRMYGIKDNTNKKNSNQNKDNIESGIFGAAPLAELYLDVSVIFADLAGFTPWASTREPVQVFQLLESIYSSFDKTAHATGVFKIETVGDCYVACCGLPEPREDHIVAAAKFCRNILHDMDSLTHKLEVTLGPDTTDLKLRIGIHSGQVTAGVLRGDKSRFQLFGDTVNTTSRMEHTSKLNRIQLSHTSAALLGQFGYGKWLRPRKELIYVQGKGEIQTHWLESKAETRKRVLNAKRKRRTGSLESPVKDKEMTVITEQENEHEVNIADIDDIDDHQGLFGTTTKIERLVNWNVGVLSQLLKQILAARNQKKRKGKDVSSLKEIEKKIGKEGTVLEQFQEIISLPQISVEDLKKRRHPKSVRLSTVILSQLHDLLTEIAGLYSDNPFHNFEHASHVTASVRKLLSRIVDVEKTQGTKGDKNLGAEKIAGHSYGITSDPLTQFAVVFSAFIHDADHPGVPNAQLVKEKTKKSIYYKEKSVAEQNSVVLAWDMLMQEKYATLRGCIYSNENELRQFRQLIVNVVMATDICDKELGALRKARWTAAFSGEEADSTSEKDINRKATIVIEHLIQASDIAHTMQHWHVYRLWNENLFKEMYSAYKAGRGDKDPSIGWYESEIGFFDFYIIPLAKKLEKCGVFGVSSHEYLDYATSNREEWKRRGKEIVEEYLENFKAKIPYANIVDETNSHSSITNGRSSF